MVTKRRFLNRKDISKDKVKPIVEVEDAADATLEKLLETITSPETEIKNLKLKIKNLEDVISHFNREDTPYKHRTATPYAAFGRSEDEFKELKEIASYILRTNSQLSASLEKVEKFPINIRDKMLLTLLISSKYNVEAMW